MTTSAYKTLGTNMSRKRFCVFCGNKPVDKTKEHIIPQWLIELTGDPKRQIAIGPFVSQKEPVKEFSFDSLSFPACKECNEDFGELEGLVKPIVINLLAGDEISAYDFDILLDWFDKVRVGLWLGWHQYLDANLWNIEPHFYISARVGLFDRALFIYIIKEDLEEIRFIGVNTPAFACVPSCFTLTINNLFLLNVSTSFLLAKQTGLPYPEKLELVEDESRAQFCRPLLVSGTEKLNAPLLDFAYDDRCTIIAQPILGWPGPLSDFEKYSDLYETEYVKNIILIPPYKGKLLLQKRDALTFYPLQGSVEWIPSDSHTIPEIIERNFIQTLRIQNSLIEMTPVSGSVPRDRRQEMEDDLSNCIKSNNFLIAKLINDWSFSSRATRSKISRNAPCPCESGKKYKHCCGKRYIFDFS